MQQYLRTMQHLIDVKIEGRTIDPDHEEDRKSIATDQNPFRGVTEFRKIRDRRFPQMFLNGALTLIAIAEVAAKATDRHCAGPICRFEFIDVSKLARGDERHTQTIDSGQCVSQRRMRKTDRGTLDRLGEIPCRRPVLLSGPGL